MQNIQTVYIKTPTVNSAVHCGEGAFYELVPQLIEEKKVFLITDSNINAIYKEQIENTFSDAPKYVLPAGEKSKNERRLLEILKAMVAAGVKRNGLVVALGGGVVGDIAGLAASLYMRGVQIMQIPTTLLSQVDSSVGGKTAIDLCGVKNIIGSFYQPETVVVDPMFLDTLPAREIRCGLGEIVKYGALNKDIYHKLIKNKQKLKDKAFLEEITHDCIEHKAYVVTEDEKETTGLRKTLNLGHTTGHAFELYYKNKSHGEFVLIGMYYELYIAVKSGICAPQYAKRLVSLIKKVIKIPRLEGAEKACLLSKYDKKNVKDAEIAMVVPQEEGVTKELKLSIELYAGYIAECTQYIKEKKEWL